MCCRFYFGDDTGEYIRSAADEIDFSGEFPSGDIHPSDKAVILSGRSHELSASGMKWGFPSYGSGTLMINARSETAWEKRAFSDSMRSRRCIVAAGRFYEWDREKNMVSFTVPDRKVICMAGIWDVFDDDIRFTVLTTAANASMLPVHDRMPVIIPEKLIRDWIFDEAAARELLGAQQPELEKYQAYEQLSFFNMTE